MRYVHLLRCPRCAGSFRCTGETLICESCRQDYRLHAGIPLLYWPNAWSPSQPDVTAAVKAFYEEHPFPGYDDFDNLGSLIDRARQGIFARLLDEEIPFGSRVLDCGCGTGQLANFLGIAHRTVLGSDICLNSLRLAQQFKLKNRLERVHFVQMNLFRPVFAQETFDVVICNGVLHHTSQPYGGFRTLVSLVKPGGYLIVGLYHRYGRIATDLRRALFRVSGNRLDFLDPRLRGGLTERRKRRWFADQYYNPHEVKHTISEVSRWLEPCGLRLVKTIPRLALFNRFPSDEKLFETQIPRGPFEQAVAELGLLFQGTAEGGFFTIIGQKNDQ